MSIRRYSDEVTAAFASRLRDAMADLRVSQAELSTRVRASTGFVSDTLRGLKLPGAQFLIAIREALELNIDWLLVGKGERFGTPIDQDLLMSLSLQVELVQLAAPGNHPLASALLRQFLPDARIDNPALAADALEAQGFLRGLSASSDSQAIAITLYNRALHVPTGQRPALLARELLALYESKRPPSILQTLKLTPKPANDAPSEDSINWNPRKLRKGEKIGDILTPKPANDAPSEDSINWNPRKLRKGEKIGDVLTKGQRRKTGKSTKRR